MRNESKDFSMILTSVEEKQDSILGLNYLKALDIFIEDKSTLESSKNEVLLLLQNLNSVCKTTALNNLAIENKALGICLVIIKEEILDLIDEALNLISKLLCCVRCRDYFPKQGFEILVDSSLRIGLKRILPVFVSICTKHEKNKQILFESKFMEILFTAFKVDNDFVLEASKLLKLFVVDDDRRNGVHPNTFVRARKLSDDINKSFVVLLLKKLEDKDQLKVIQSSIVDSLTFLLVNNKICGIALKKNALLLLENIFLSKNRTDKVNVLRCLKSLTRNDSVKLSLANTNRNFLFKILQCLAENKDDNKLVVQILDLLAILSLRQPDICKLLQSQSLFETITSVMTIHGKEYEVQRSSMLLLRNCISSQQNKDLVNIILGLGLESLFRKAREHYPNECEEAAFALLRDLGLKYHITA